MKSGAGGAVKPLSTNTQPCYVGHDSTVSSATGWELVPGEPFGLDVLNLGKLWVIGNVGEKLCWSTIG
jgi:hypothetical protein